MKMQTKMIFEPNGFKIYDIIAHRSFWVNRRDIDVAATKKRGGPLCPRSWKDARSKLHYIVFVHEWANKKTPHYEGRFAVPEKTYMKIITVPRKDW